MHILPLSAAILYVIAALFSLTPLYRRHSPTRLAIITPAIAALCAHFLWLGNELSNIQGQDLNILNVASIATLLIALLATMALLRYKIWITLPIAYGIAATAQLLSLLNINHHFVSLTLKPALLLHIGIALFTYAILMMAALQALQLWYLDRSLKTRSKMAIHPELPPLLTVENQLFIMIRIGTALLTLLLINGYLFIDELFSQQNLHKALFSLAAWLNYLLLLWGKRKMGWRGQTIVLFCLTGALLLTLAYFGSQLFNTAGSTTSA